MQPHYNRINPLNAELNPICHLLALLGAHHILHISRIRVNHTPMYFNGLFYNCNFSKNELMRSLMMV